MRAGAQARYFIKPLKGLSDICDLERAWES